MSEDQHAADELMSEDGYPSQGALARIRAWAPEDGIGLLSFVHGLWRYVDHISASPDDNGIWSVSTGGWSGHEDIIEAMTDNQMWWTLHWESSRRGGHYTFKPRRFSSSES